MRLFPNIRLGNKDIALIDENGSCYTYEQIFVEVKRLSKFFKDRTVCLFPMDSSIGSVCTYLSFLNSGCIPILINHNLSENSIRKLIQIYKPENIIYSKLKDFELNGYECNSLNQDFNLYQKKQKQEPVKCRELSILLSTSGSTGSPKLVRISNENILENTKSICEYLKLTKRERAITSLPLSYSFGLSILQTHLFVGASIVLTNKSIIEKEFWNICNEQKVTFFSGVPFTYEVLEKLDFRKSFTNNFKYLVQAGGKLSDELIKQYSEYSSTTKRQFFVMYGQTEATARMSYLPPSKTIDKFGSIGIAIPGGKFSLESDDGKIIRQTFDKGELVYKGKNVSLGYAESRHDLNLGDCFQGILKTGDIAYFDDDSYFYLVGRKKRFVKIQGNRISLDEVENILKLKKFDCACTGNDSIINIHICGKDVEIKLIQREISKEIKIHPNFLKVNLVGDLPRTNSGKIDYAKL